MKERPAIEGEVENLGTADNYATIVKAIHDRSAASSRSCDAMLEMLEKQQNTRRIARFLPDHDDVRWGSKTGSLTGVTNDAGFIQTSLGTMILAVFCESFPDQHLGEHVIGEISRAALNCVGLV